MSQLDVPDGLPESDWTREMCEAGMSPWRARQAVQQVGPSLSSMVSGKTTCSSSRTAGYSQLNCFCSSLYS